MRFDNRAVAGRIESALVSEWELDATLAQDIAFHMTDWLDELASYAEFCRHPEDFDADSVTSVVTAFLVHVPHHLVAAKKLAMDEPVTDIFEIDDLDNDADV